MTRKRQPINLNRTVETRDLPQGILAAADQARDLTTWVEREQENLWHDLDDAVRDASNGSWSIAAENAATRIVGAIHLVGPTPPGNVPWRLSAGGVYEELLKVAGAVPEPISDEQWAMWDGVMGHLGTRDQLLREMALTVTAIRTYADRLKENSDG